LLCRRNDGAELRRTFDEDVLPSCGRKTVGELDDAQLLDRFGTLGANADGHELPRAC